MNNPFKKKKQTLDEEEKRIVKEMIDLGGMAVKAQQRNSQIIYEQQFAILLLMLITLGLAYILIKKRMIS